MKAHDYPIRIFDDIFSNYNNYFFSNDILYYIILYYIIHVCVPTCTLQRVINLLSIHLIHNSFFS